MYADGYQKKQETTTIEVDDEFLVALLVALLLVASLSHACFWCLCSVSNFPTI